MIPSIFNSNGKTTPGPFTHFPARKSGGVTSSHIKIQTKTIRRRKKKEERRKKEEKKKKERKKALTPKPNM